MTSKTEMIVALDFPGMAPAMALVERLGDSVSWYKVGKQLFTLEGPPVVRELHRLGKRVFLDMKFHDIPNTVHGAVCSAAAIGADLINVHASGGPAMLEAAAKAAAETGKTVVAVTVLTSMDRAQLAAVGLDVPPQEQVLRLARLTRECGLPGVVCSPQEVALLRQELGAEFLTVVPGIRPQWAVAGDQKRIMTPAEAHQAGARYIVVGRPVTGAPEPAEAARRILAEMGEAQ